MNGYPSMNPDRSTACPDPETLAAFIDRRLPDAERGRLAEHLSECPDCYEIFVDTVRVLEEEPDGVGEGADPVVDRESGQAPIRPPVRPGPWARVVRTALPLAAVLIVAVGVWLVVQPGGGADDGAPGAGLPEAGALVAELRMDAVTDEVFESRGWPVTRGGASPGNGPVPTRAVDRDVAFRLGALTVDLATALNGRRTELAIRLTHQIEDLLAEEVDLSEPLVRSYRDLRGSLEAGETSSSAAGRAAEAASLVEERVGAAVFRLGAWAEAGRLAAQGGDARFFDRPVVRRSAERLDGQDLGSLELPPEVVREVERVTRLLEAGAGPDDLSTLERAFTEIVRRGGGR